MKTFVQIAAVATVLAATSASIVFGAPATTGMASKTSVPATMTCPACGMPMSKTKNAMFTTPVYSKAKKTVYYCCGGCKAGKAAAAYYKAHKKPMPV